MLRLVYADWLEERGTAIDLQRAEYLRIECEADRLRAKDPRRPQLAARLKKLSRQVGDDWWQVLDYADVEHCVTFEFRCPQRWDTLTPTDRDEVRFCEECKETVHYCRNDVEAQRLADNGKCVAIDSRQMHMPLTRAGYMRMGKIAPRVSSRIPLPMRGSLENKPQSPSGGA
jgi:uncharacterized protein (TIGR02996 family)